MIAMELRGMDKVIGNLKKAKKVTGAAFERGLIEGAQFLQRESMKIVPINKDILRMSINIIC